MITGLAHGAAEIFPVSTIEEAFTLHAAEPGALLGGERHGEKIDGFDLGNSPFEYRECAGRTVISTTTNGTVALRACARREAGARRRDPESRGAWRMNFDVPLPSGCCWSARALLKPSRWRMRGRREN